MHGRQRRRRKGKKPTALAISAVGKNTKLKNSKDINQKKNAAYRGRTREILVLAVVLFVLTVLYAVVYNPVLFSATRDYVASWQERLLGLTQEARILESVQNITHTAYGKEYLIVDLQHHTDMRCKRGTTKLGY